VWLSFGTEREKRQAAFQLFNVLWVFRRDEKVKVERFLVRRHWANTKFYVRKYKRNVLETSRVPGRKDPLVAVEHEIVCDAEGTH
jgi:hypothetical protein